MSFRIRYHGKVRASKLLLQTGDENRMYDRNRTDRSNELEYYAISRESETKGVDIHVVIRDW